MDSRQSRHVVRSMLFWIAVALSGAVDAQEVTRKSEKQPTDSGQDDPSTQSAVQLDTVQVTGTRIKGGTTPSPVITIDSTRIREEGFTDLGEVIRSLPQNFGGGQNPGVAVGATAGAGGLANQNVTGGSALNLRGLGPDATLTLLNGRRLSYGGFVQAVDISAIPLEAVDRIEIVPDGASALYGSDAVGGVGNVILKRDYQGAKLGWRYGGATDGGLNTREYTATAGMTWSGGGLLVAGQSTSVDPIYARQRDYTRQMFDPSTLYPGSDLRSGLVTLHQALDGVAELHLDALRTNRAQQVYPWNTGLTSYHYRTTPDSRVAYLSPSVDFRLSGGWTASLSGGWGKDETVQHQSTVDNATGASQLVVRECYCNEVRAWDADVEGPLWFAQAGETRLALGIGGRKNAFTYHDLINDSDVARGEEHNRFAYAELSVPLIGVSQGVVGVRRLALTAALRTEDYSSFGRVTVPKLGIIYDPNDSLTLKGSWGKSFKAPTLFQRYQSRTVFLDPAAWYGGADDAAPVLATFGGEVDLRPERALTRTLSLAVHPKSWPGFETELTWFDVDYSGRVVQPITDYGNALGNPDYAQFIEYAPAPQRQAEVLAAGGTFYNETGQPYDSSNVSAILAAQYVNVARQRIKGVDLSTSYRMDLDAGRVTLRGAGTWLNSTQQNSDSTSPYDVSGRLFNPAKLNARVGAVWDLAELGFSAFANYTGGVTDTASRRKTASFTTFDATVRYVPLGGSGPISGIEIALALQNLLDRAPPSYRALSPDRPPYDSTNYSAIGRFVSLSVSRRW
ncbi:TonB-dependent receptor [Pseudoxanthomonas winnipegensis]|uniref:TonB-dependent receptor n=2 Tax=Pseudoxanthomonas winnipegensis TaxID=2480810 RepID=A0A4Q8L9C9_9GAMM|nr:TonB-dependent receptor [Pseudoxanthomonas winnipegensis]TAA24722.1 TonB-dependent receptor [Pseudoxanthomonas winnipegensis]TAA39974.1 TonB-dependent receptor [Pseudoxanthomonas winnipegensis]TBV74601.1 TonB-dependent receptor [Pseudoxanthomonas winnipegensis]